MRWAGVASVVSLALILAVVGCGRAGGSDSWVGQDYVALGDSYTAAPGTGADLGTVCYQSARNYPRLVAAALDLDLTDASCSGARTEHLLEVQEPSSAPPQLRHLSAETDLVTVRLGANDAGLYAATAHGCPQVAPQDPEGAPCAAALGGEAWLDDHAADLETDLTRGLERVRDRAPTAHVVVVGYPEWAPPSEAPGCARLPLAAGDRAFVRRANLVMVEAAERAAAAVGVAYLDVWQATEGHHMCATDPWIAGLVPAVSAAALHPHPEEQQVVAELLVAHLSAAEDRAQLTPTGG